MSKLPEYPKYNLGTVVRINQSIVGRIVRAAIAKVDNTDTQEWAYQLEGSMDFYAESAITAVEYNSNSLTTDWTEIAQ